MFSGLLELACPSCRKLILHISSQLCSWWLHVGSLTSAVLGVFAPQTSVNATNPGLFFPGEQVVQCYQHSTINTYYVYTYICMFLPLWRTNLLTLWRAKGQCFQGGIQWKGWDNQYDGNREIRKNGNFGIRQTWDRILTSLFPYCVIPCKSLTSSGSQFTHLKNGDLCLSLKVVLRIKWHIIWKVPNIEWIENVTVCYYKPFFKVLEMFPSAHTAVIL